MDIASLCQREVVCIPQDASLRQAATLMCDEHIGALVVTDSDELHTVKGIVTDRDLTLQVVGRGDAALDLTVGHLASHPPVGIPGTSSVLDAVTAMQREGVRRLLVLDGDSGVMGIVSADDIVGAIAEELEGLARALRSGVAREKRERYVAEVRVQPRPMFPGFGMAAMQ